MTIPHSEIPRVMRPIKPPLDYSGIESRQEMGFRLKGFIGHIQEDPHVNLVLEGPKSGRYRPSGNADFRHIAPDIGTLTQAPMHRSVS